jgi:hypothetical protein
MYSPEHLTAQIVLYVCIFAIYAVALVSAARGTSKIRQWLGITFAITYSENVVAFPAALFGYAPHQWLLGLPATTKYLGLVLTGMSATTAGFVLFSKLTGLPTVLANLPPLRMPDALIRRLAFAISSCGAAAAIALSAQGYFGYFTAVSNLYNPPAWLDSARLFVNIGMGLSFGVFVYEYTNSGSLRPSGWLLVGLWTAAGVTTAFKTFVVLPSFFVLLAGWLASRLRVRHCLLFATAILLSYTLVEPLRELKAGTDSENALATINVLASEEGVTLPAVGDVLDRLLSRVDYTATAVETLEADTNGQVDVYRRRLGEVYRLLPMLAFVPAAIWPDKPLADLGRELSILLSGNSFSSVTPSNVVASYLWLGVFGVALNAVLGSYFIVLAGRLIERYLSRPLAYLPAFFLVLVFSSPEAIKAYTYIGIVRATVAVALFYWVGRAFGFVSHQPSRTAVRLRPTVVRS